MLFLLSSCTTSHNDSNHNYNEKLSNSDYKEIEIGRQIHRQILSSFSLFTEERANQYVNHITEEISKVSSRPNLPYDCTILASDKIYATGAPGGHVYITTGFINILDNETELAGVLAHEVAQLQYRNPKYSGAKKSLEVMEVVTGVAGGFFGPFGVLAFVGVATLNQLTTSKNVDSLVLLADKKALVYMNKAGYDPQGFVDVLYKIIYADQMLIPYMIDYYQSRPVSADRMIHLENVFKKMTFENKQFDTERERFNMMTSGVKQLYGVEPV